MRFNHNGNLLWIGSSCNSCNFGAATGSLWSRPGGGSTKSIRCGKWFEALFPLHASVDMSHKHPLLVIR
jgi:hypothetical protein